MLSRFELKHTSQTNIFVIIVIITGNMHIASVHLGINNPSILFEVAAIMIVVPTTIATVS
jgi:hypothetical protein